MPEKFPTEPSPEEKKNLEKISRQEQELFSKGWQKLNAEPESLKLDTYEAEEKLEEKYLKKHGKIGFYQVDLVPKNEGTKKGPYLYDVYMRTPEAAQKEREKQKEIRKELEALIGRPLKEKGFLKERSNWRRELKDLIDVFHLQKSQFGDSYMIELGIFLKERKDMSFADWRPNIRIEELMPKEGWKAIREALDFNTTQDIETARRQIETIREAIEKYAIPFFESLKSAKAVKDYFKKMYEGNKE